MTTWSEASDGSVLQALLAAIARSPIVVWPILASSATRPAAWAAVRKSGNADAFVLAWIAGHVRGSRRAPRILN
jgi:hypothetical protein